MIWATVALGWIVCLAVLHGTLAAANAASREENFAVARRRRHLTVAAHQRRHIAR